MNQIPVILTSKEQAPTQFLKVLCYGQEGASLLGQEELERGDLPADWPGPGTTNLRAGGGFSSTLETLRVGTCRQSTLLGSSG